MSEMLLSLKRLSVICGFLVLNSCIYYLVSQHVQTVAKQFSNRIESQSPHSLHEQMLSLSLYFRDAIFYLLVIIQLLMIVIVYQARKR